MDRRVTPLRRLTSPTWGPPPPCKQALSMKNIFQIHTDWENSFSQRDGVILNRFYSSTS